MLYRKIIRPLLFRLPAETAHEIGLNALRLGASIAIGRRLLAGNFSSPPILAIDRFGLTFPNPVGVAAGFDKNGMVVNGLSALGFGFVEVGTVTRLPQPGNDRPRLFRLPQDRAIVNRLGFNNRGASALAERLTRDQPNGLVGVNIGKSRAVPLEQAADDYLATFALIFPVADYITVNVSSPNTPSLRNLQCPAALNELLTALQIRNRELGASSGQGPVPLLVKISPDLSERELEAVVETAVDCGLSGIIATNTTVRRDGLRSPIESVTACGDGGLSGQPVRARSTAIIARIHRRSEGKLTVIGVGGIFSAHDAWEKISAGASLVQVYTGFVYEGAGIARAINAGLAEILTKHGLKSLDEVIGCQADEYLF